MRLPTENLELGPLSRRLRNRHSISLMDTSNSDDTTYLSQVTIQADLQSVIDDVRNGDILVEDVWVSCYAQRTTSVHGKAAVSLSNDSKRQIEMEGRDGVQARSLDRVSMFQRVIATST